MIELKQLIRFPATFKEREKLVDQVKLTSIIPTKTDYGFEIKSQTNKYKQIMEIHDSKISVKSPVKVSCDCESFKYEFCNAIYKAGSLVNAFSFLRSIISRPKEKNQYNVISGCKHLIKMSREVLKIKV